MRLAAVVLVAVTTIAYADAPRDAIERARELEAKLAYDEALAIIDSAIQAGQSNRDRLVELHLIAGRLNAGLDRSKPAEEHFAIVLALAPQTTLPDDTSPKIAVPFTVARTKATPLVVKLVVDTAHVAVEGGGAIVAGIAVRYRAAAGENTLLERSATSVARPPESTIVEVRALDRYGNEVWSGAPPPEEIHTPPPIVHHEQPSLFGRWTTWAALTGVALAAGGVAAWRFEVAQHDFDDKRDAGMTDFSELQAIEDRGRRWGLTANISFGVAAATGIVSIVLFVRRPTEPVVTVTPSGVAIAGRF